MLVKGEMACALGPLVGRPVAEVPLWQVVQLSAAVTPVCAKLVGSHAVVRWQLEHCTYPVVEIWLALGGVQLLPPVTWQLVQDVAPLWFIVTGIHPPPMPWQLAQVLAVIGAVVCALAPLTGRPVAEVPLWQVVQSLPAVMPPCANEVGNQAVVA